MAVGWGNMQRSESDERLLDLWNEGDTAAGSILIERYFDRVYRFLCNKVSDGLEDLVQQVFLGCLEGGARFRGQSSFRGYLFGIARNQLLNHYRDAQKQAQADSGVTSLSAAGTTPTGALARDDARRVLHAALRQLPVDQQIALELTYWENLNGPELADALGVPLDTAYSRVRRARIRLGELISELSADPSAPSDPDAIARRMGELGPIS